MPHRKRHMHRVARYTLVLALAFSAAPAFAAPAPTAANIAGAQQQAAAAQARVASMQADLSKGMASYSQAAADLAKTRADLDANAKRLTVIDAQMKGGEVELSSRADFLYRTGGAGFIDVVFGSSSFEEFASRLYVVTRIADQEAQLISTLKADHAEAAQLRTELAAKEAEQKALLGKVAARRDSVQSALDQQQAYVDSLSSDVSALLAARQRAESRSTPTSPDPSLPDPGPTPAPKQHAAGVGYADATVTGRSGTYKVMADEPRKYQPTSISFSGGCSVWSTADGSSSTASGHRLVDSELVCAHKTLPFGTRVALTRGGRKCIVVVIDRGPYVRGRVLDVTPAVARILGIDGVGDVHAEVVKPL